MLKISENEPLLFNATMNKNSNRFYGSHLSLFKTLDLFITAFVVTPLTVTYWIATWDLFTIYIFKNSLFLSCMLTGLVANLFLWLSYLVQHELQQLHDNNTSRDKSALFKYVLRFAYTYLTSLAYIAQWRSYWDILNYVTLKIPFYYSIVITCLTLLVSRFVLGRSFSAFIKLVPFYSVRGDKSSDSELRDFFKKPIVFTHTRRFVESTLNFLYVELVEMLLSVLVWKGVWDTYERGLMDSFATNNTTIFTYWFTIKLTLVVGYFFYFLTFFVHKLIVDELANRGVDLKTAAFKSHLLNVFYLVCFALGTVALWRSFFSAFDYFILSHPHRYYFITGSHLVIFIFMYLVGLGPALNGPASYDPDDYFQHNNQQQKQQQNSFFVMKASYFV